MSDLSSSSRSLPELPPGSRYELLFKLASGGMASVYVGRLRAAGGFWRLVAIKKAHAHLMEDRSFRRMLVEEARLASRIHHPNVVAVQDVEQLGDHLLLVMDYIEGASLAELLVAHRQQPLPPRIAVRIALDACAGLHAAHELTDASGKPLQIVHRDVSPQNLLVGVDGVARLTDFGIAKSTFQGATTTTGALKGKLAYMAPEYVDGKQPDQRSDVFGLGVVIWEALANRRLFRGESEVETLRRVVEAKAPLLSEMAPWLGTDLDPVLSAALARDPNERFTTAKALGNALEIAARGANLAGSAEEVGAHVRSLFAQTLDERRRFIHSRVATDAGGPPSSASNLATSTGAGALSGPAEPPTAQAATPQAVPARTAPRHLAATVRDADLGGGGPAAPRARDGSPQEGSGVSHPGWDRPHEDASPRPHRALWLGAGAALLAGGLAAIGVFGLRGDDAHDSTATPSAPPPTELTATPAVTPATTAAAGSKATAGAPGTSASSAPAPGSAPPAASSSATSSARKPLPLPRTGASASGPAESIPPNPYGAGP